MFLGAAGRTNLNPSPKFGIPQPKNPTALAATQGTVIFSSNVPAPAWCSDRYAYSSYASGTVWSKYDRNMASYHKTFLFLTYGGQLWAILLACLGWVDVSVVVVVNDVLSQRITDAGRTPDGDLDAEIPDPRLSRRALAASQGQALPEKRGVNHVTSEAKSKRDQAKRADKVWRSLQDKVLAGFHADRTRRGDWWETEDRRLSWGQGGSAQGMLQNTRFRIFFSKMHIPALAATQCVFGVAPFFVRCGFHHAYSSTSHDAVRM